MSGGSFLSCNDKTEIRLFANEKAFQTDVLEALEKDGVTLFPYDSIYEYVKTFKKDKKVFSAKRKSTVVWLAIFRQTLGFWMKKILHFFPRQRRILLRWKMNALRISETELQLQVHILVKEECWKESDHRIKCSRKAI